MTRNLNKRVLAGIAAVACVCLAIAGVIALRPKGEDSIPADEPTQREAPSDAANYAEPATDDEASLPAGEPVGDDIYAGTDAAELLMEPAVSNESPEPFVMPEGANFEPQVALVQVDPNLSIEEVREALEPIEAVDASKINEDDLAYGIVCVPVVEGVTVEEAVNELRTLDVVEIAEPNYIYQAQDLIEDEYAPADDEQGDDDKQQGEDGESTLPAEPVDDGDAADEPDASGQEADDNEQGLVDKGDEDEETTQTSETQTETEPAEDASAETQEIADEATEEGLDAEAARTSVNDPNSGSQWALSSIRAYEAWSVAKANRQVGVAVIDTGFDQNHADLKNNVALTYDASTDKEGANVSYAGPTAGNTNQSHGTHVAGIIAAEANNKLGVTGVSYNAKLVLIKVTDSSGNVTSEYVKRAYEKICDLKSSRSDLNIRVANISMGTSDKKFGDTIQSSLDAAWNKGIVTVNSAGNGSNSDKVPYAHYPSDCKNVVGVIYLQQSGSSVERNPSSNYNRSAGDNKNISAPGTDIYSTIPGSYGYKTGSSMAAPHVSAVLALEFAAKPSLSAADAVKVLYGTATDLGAKGWDTTYGYGEVNAYYAVRGAKEGLTAAQKAMVQEQEQIAQQKRDAAAITAIRYRTHVQDIGWQGFKTQGQLAGTTGQAKRLEGIEIKLQGAPYSGSIQYRTHVQDIGWQSYVADGAMAGTTGKAKRLEAIQIRLTGEMAAHYDVWYRVHAQDYGWLGWAKNDARSGTATLAKRLEGIEIRILPKGSAAPGTTATPYVTRQVSYRTHVQDYGWQGYVYDGSVSGTTGRAKRLEGINVSLSDPLYSGGIQYRTHVQDIGWQGWRSNGALAGTTGQAKRLEAIQIQLTGDMAKHYDVWYRVHCQDFGWMGWAKNGASAGTAGYAKRLEGIQIRLVPQGAAAPGSTANAFRQR